MRVLPVVVLFAYVAGLVTGWAAFRGRPVDPVTLHRIDTVLVTVKPALDTVRRQQAVARDTFTATTADTTTATRLEARTDSTVAVADSLAAVGDTAGAYVVLRQATDSLHHVIDRWRDAYRGAALAYWKADSAATMAAGRLSQTIAALEEAQRALTRATRRCRFPTVSGGLDPVRSGADGAVRGAVTVGVSCGL